MKLNSQYSLYTVSALGLILMVIYLYIWPNSDRKNLTHARPSGIPEQSHWVGGVDGGNFYFCEKAALGLTCKIFNDQSGQLQWKGHVPLESWELEKYKTSEDFYADIDAYDGKSLYLISRQAKLLDK